MDWEAAMLFSHASLSPRGVHPVAEVCRRLLRHDPIVRPIEEEGRLDGALVILRTGMPPSRARYVCAREVARWWLERSRWADPLEDQCRRLAGAVLCPREPFEEDVADVGWDVRELARRYGVPEALALLRLGEVTGQRVALVDRSVVILRGCARSRMRRVVLSDDDRHGLMGGGGGRKVYGAA